MMHKKSSFVRNSFKCGQLHNNIYHINWRKPRNESCADKDVFAALTRNSVTIIYLCCSSHSAISVCSNNFCANVIKIIRSGCHQFCRFAVDVTQTTSKMMDAGKMNSKSFCIEHGLLVDNFIYQSNTNRFVNAINENE